MTVGCRVLESDVSPQARLNAVAEISRRAVVALLGAGAVAAGAQYGLKAAGSPVGPSEAEPGDDNPIRAENRRAGSRDWKIGSGSTVAADDLGRQISGYVSDTGVTLGPAARLPRDDVQTRYRLHHRTIYRFGYYGGQRCPPTGRREPDIAWRHAGGPDHRARDRSDQLWLARLVVVGGARYVDLGLPPRRVHHGRRLAQLHAVRGA